MNDVRKDIRFIDSHYNTLFTVKDGEKIKFTAGYDGEVKTPKCRWLDEAHITLTDKYQNHYHICEFAEVMERNGSKYEPIQGQKPVIDVLYAKYGEKLADTEVPMTDAAIKRLVGGKYDTELLYVDGQGINGDYGPQVNGAVLRGRDGIMVCGSADGALTSLHPYRAQMYKREITTERPEQNGIGVGGRLAAARAEAKAQNAAVKEPHKRAGPEI